MTIDLNNMVELREIPQRVKLGGDKIQYAVVCEMSGNVWALFNWGSDAEDYIVRNRGYSDALYIVDLATNMRPEEPK